MAPTRTTLIFDFDGTLCDSFEAFCDALNHYSDDFGYRRIESDERERLKDKAARDVLKHLGISGLKLPFLVRKVRHRLADVISELIPCPGIPDVIRKLNDMSQVKMGILSSNSEQNIHAFLQKHGLNGFDFIHSGSSVFGKHRVLRGVIRSLGTQGGQIFYVGDEARDVVAAKTVGIQAVAVTWGYNSRKALEREMPDALLSQPADLLRLITASRSVQE